MARNVSIRLTQTTSETMRDHYRRDKVKRKAKTVGVTETMLTLSGRAPPRLRDVTDKQWTFSFLACAGLVLFRCTRPHVENIRFIFYSLARQTFWLGSTGECGVPQNQAGDVCSNIKQRTVLPPDNTGKGQPNEKCLCHNFSTLLRYITLSLAKSFLPFQDLHTVATEL